MDRAEAEQEEELSEWVVTSPKSSPIDASTPPTSPILQPSHRRESPTDDDDDDEDEDSVVPFIGEEEEGEDESSSTVNLSFPWRVIETTKKRLIQDSVLFFQAVERVRCDYVTRRRVFWSLTLIGGFSLVSSLVYVKLVRWWRRVHEEKLRFLLLLLKEKDQKIKELMVEIGRLNELLLSRRRVRVVFLNYRGEQLRYSFVSHLIDAFERNEINVFVDKYEQRGKDLKNLFLRIQESRIALAIFSTRYTESSWCMDELVKIKKLADKRKLHVIPIFYKVKAEDVRKQTGEFGDNFWTLAKVSSGDQIKKWKEALECISDKMGLSLGDQSSEADFVKEAVKAVQRVVAEIGFEEEENHFGEKKRKDCKCELPDFKKSRTKKL